MSLGKDGTYSEATIRRHGELLSNRCKKRFKHFFKRYDKAGIDCFRLYDWDIPEIRAVVDYYRGHLVVGEYQRSQTGENWLPGVATGLSEALNIPAENVHLKQRRTATEGERYKPLQKQGMRFEVREHQLKFWVNPSDFLDTGLFSDHRITRQRLMAECQGKTVLNLFSYTGAFTVAAAEAGAEKVTSVDRNDTYLKWAEDNLRLNDLGVENCEFIQTDAFHFLERAIRQERKYDIIVVDPPSFFQDREKNERFDIFNDHPELLASVFNLVQAGGKVYFSTNHQRFEEQFNDLEFKEVREISAQTVPEDYRNRKVHRCWEFTF